MKMTTDPIGLYVHVPFCVKKCSYCDFCSFPIGEIKGKDKYIDALCSEIRSYGHRGLSLDSIFFGGGTPSLLCGDDFRKITCAIRESFELCDGLEFTIEANPKTLTEENLREYISCGVNRVSIGLQTIHENELKKLGRIHSFEDFINTYALVRKLGIKNVSVDLMYGIPDQKDRTFMETLERVVALDPTHISVYGLIVEEGTPISEMISELDLPTEDEECDMYSLACDLLKKHGYNHYEIANYAKDGYQCKHNLKYWMDKEYIGVGVSAYSYFDGGRYGNSRNFAQYLSDYSKCRTDTESIDDESEKFEYAMLRLRLSEGFSLDDYTARFSESFLSGREVLVDRLCREELMRIVNRRISLTEKGFYVSNSILAELL